MTPMSAAVRKLADVEIDQVLADSRIASLRWDLLPWALVLDLDVGVRDGEGEECMCRAWIAFEGVTDSTWPFDRVRVPSGWWSTTRMQRSQVEGGLVEFRFSVLAPQAEEDGGVAGDRAAQVVLRAKAVRGVMSVKAALTSPFGLTYRNRTALATDVDLLELLTSVSEQQ